MVTEQVNGQLRTIWTVAGTTVLLAGILAYFMAGAVTRRLQRLRTATEMLADGNLDTRTDEGGAPELKALAGSFNRMADRLKDLLDQQRGFASDASHGLRTPLTGLRLRLENAVDTIPTDPEAGRSMVAASLDETYRLQRIIDGLLLLSKAEGKAAVLGTTDLVNEVKARTEQWEALAEETGVRLKVAGLPTADILALPGAAEQIIDNLIDNALAVAPPGSLIQLVVSHGEQPDVIELHILDEGPGFPRRLPPGLQPLLARHPERGGQRPRPVHRAPAGPGQRCRGLTDAQNPRERNGRLRSGCLREIQVGLGAGCCAIRCPLDPSR